MSMFAVFNAVKAYLAANWTATPLAFSNAAYQPSTDPFVFVEISGGLLEQTSIGSGSPTTERWRAHGSVMLHVAVPVGTGVELAYQYADDLTNLLRGLELPDEIRFQDMTVNPGEAEDDGAMFVVSIRADWIRG